MGGRNRLNCPRDLPDTKCDRRLVCPPPQSSLEACSMAGSTEESTTMSAGMSTTSNCGANMTYARALNDAKSLIGLLMLERRLRG